MEDNSNDAYSLLRFVLSRAYRRAAFGKGKERHVLGGERFLDQYIIRGARTFGLGGLLFQIGKKIEEVLKTKDPDELLDVIVYAAAAYIVLMDSIARDEGKATEDDKT